MALQNLVQEVRALRSRLRRVQPLSLGETTVAAAALSPHAMSSIEAHLLAGRRVLHSQIETYLRWLDGLGKGATPDEAQRRYVFLRLRFNAALSQLDIFSEALSQRSAD